MYAAYDALSPTMQEMVKDLRVKYPPQAGLVEYAARHLGEEMANRIRDAVGDGGEHPLVRTHPWTGRRALYFARGFAGSVAGLNDDETRALWPFLEGIAANPNIQCRWRWHDGDVVIWDERATQHFGAADHRGQERLMRRVMVTGETPV
jgi:taurine dioxygenase